MKQFTFSAQVANNLLTVLQGYSKTIRLLLVILTMFVLSIGQMYGYTITFNGNASESTSLSTSTTAASITGNSTYVTGNLVTATKVYGATSDGVKLGTSSVAGTIKFNLSTTGQVTPTSIVVNCKLYNSSKSATLKVNGSATQNVPSSSGNLTFAITSPITYIELVSNKYIWIKSVTVNTAAGSTTYKVTYDKNGATSGSVPTDATSYNSGATVTVKSNSGNLAKTGYTFGGWNTKSDGTGTNYTAGSGTFTITANTTLYAKWNTATKYTVTLDAGSGTCAASVTEASAGDGVTLPTPTLDCGDWEFAGWKTTSAVTTETTTEPTLIPAGNYKPSNNITLYAVYQRTETTSGGGGGSTEVTFNFGYTDWGKAASFSGTTYNTVQQNDNGVSVTYTRNDGSLYANSTSLRLYKTNTLTFDAGSNTITSITFTGSIGQSDITTDAGTCTNSTNTLSWAGSSTSVTFTRPSNAASYATLTSAILTIGSGSTTYYHSTPDCAAGDPCASLQAPDVTATATANSITLSWDAVDGATSYNVYNYTTADLDETTSLTYTFTGLSSETEYEWGVESAKGECFKEFRGTTTTLAAASPATITLSELGVTTTDNTTYYVGEQYTLPTTSSQSCAGKQLVGWSTVEVAETDTKPTENYYELGAEVTLAATQTFYAVFAASSGGGGETWTLVTNESNLEVGDQIVIAAKDHNYAISTTQNGNNRGQAAVTKNGETITFGNDVQVLTLQTGNVSNSFAFYTGSGYLYAASSSSNYLRTENTLSNNSSWNIEITDAGVATITAQGTNTKNLLRYNSTSSIFSCYSSGQLDVSIYKKAGGGGYTAYSTSCIPTYSITYDFAGGTGSHCSNTSVPQNSSCRICDEAPTKDGNTFLHWSDGVNTYDPSDVIATVTTDITLTAVWQPNTYTVTWNSNGEETEVPYNHGVALVVPEEPESCDGVKEFVGWTEQSGYYHATTAPTDLFKTTTATVTADKTYYAVFATPPGTGGGGGGSETTTTLDFTAQGYSNGVAISNLTVSGVTATFDKGSNGSNAPKYYTSGTAIRTYGGNTITLSSTGTITNVTFTFSGGDDGNEITTNNGDGEYNEPTWTGNTTSNIVFTIGGTSGHRRIKSIAVTCTSGGGSGSYSDYTTTCQQVESIVVTNPKTDFLLTEEFTIGEGTVTAKLSGGGTADVTTLATFSGYNMEVVGTYTVTVTYMGATATYNINVNPLNNAWVLTWNVSGKTNTGLGPRYVTKGSAIGTLPTPEVPAACAGKTFMGWTTSNIVNSDGTGITYITPETVPTDNTTYYAVFATVNNFCTQKPIGQIASGSKVVIVAVASLDAGGTTGKAISSRTADDGNNLASDDVFVLDEQINTPHSTCVWTLTREDGKYIFTQDGKYLNAIVDPDKTTSGFCKFNSTKDTWTISEGATNTYRMFSTNQSKYVEWFTATGVFKVFHIANTFGTFDMQFFVTANANGGADITDYTTGCAEYTITYYGFHGGYSTSCSSDGTIVLPVNSIHTIPNCEGLVINDHTNLGREFLNVWMTQPHGGHTFKPGDTFILTQDTTLYAQWKMETTSDVTTLPTDIEDLAGTDIYVYGGTTLNIQPGTTTINSLTLKGGLQADGSYKMPTVWVPEGATLVRNSNKIYLDLVVNAENWYPFAVPFETKNTSDIHYLHPDMRAAATYGQHFDIKTYDGARRAAVGEDKANNWVRLKRHTTAEPVSFKPGIGYIISAMAYPGEDTATIRIPMSVPNTWFKNGEQAEVGTTVRNTIAVTAHAGAAATEHQRHAGWNFVANPYLTSFTGGNVANDGGLAYINGELIIEGSYEYGGDPVPYVTIPAYDFAYYSQHKLSDVKLSPEWSFFVQVGTGGTMNFTTAGRQQAPASIAARNAEERPVKMDVDLILSDNHNSDQTGLIICDRYSDAYEIGRDLEKLFGSAYNLSVYTLMEDNTPLAFQALAIRSSMQVIPVGYRAPEQGEYTFRLNEATSSIDLLNEQYEQLVLVDYQTGELTNLLYTDYTFYSERTQSNSRFAIYAVPRQNAPTDLPNAIGSDEEVRKVIYNDHLYILRDGNVYNGMGQKM